MSTSNQNCWLIRHSYGSRYSEYHSAERASALILFNQLTTDAMGKGPSGILSLIWFDGLGKENSLMTVEIN